MNIILIFACIATVTVFAGVIATWAVIYSSDIGSGENIFEWMKQLKPQL